MTKDPGQKTKAKTKDNERGNLIQGNKRRGTEQNKTRQDNTVRHKTK